MRRRVSCSSGVSRLISLVTASAWPGNSPRNKPLAFSSEINLDQAPVVLLPLASNPAMFLKIVDDERHVAAAAKELFGQRVLAHRPQVQQSFHDAELAHRQAALFDLSAHARRHGIGSADEVHEGIERPDGFFASLEVSRHIVQA